MLEVHKGAFQLVIHILGVPWVSECARGLLCMGCGKTALARELLVPSYKIEDMSRYKAQEEVAKRQMKHARGGLFVGRTGAGAHAATEPGVTGVHAATSNAARLSDPTKFVGVVGVAMLVLVLIPLVLISAYNHSYADDWHYGVWAHLALHDVSNPFEGFFVAIWTALQQAGKAWIDWQGSYSAIFLMALEPSVFGEQYYVLAAPIVLAVLIAGTFFFGHVYLCERMDAPRGLWLGLSSLLVSVQLLQQPSPVEGIFWFNSAVYYTVYNAAALAMLGCLGRICNPERATKPRGVMVAYCLLAVFVAGGNFVTALVLFEVMTVAVVVLWRSQRRCTLEALIGYVLLLLGLVVSFAAPGNSVRQATQFPEDSAGVWGTIWGSSLACFQYIQEWSNGLVLLLVVAAAGVALYVVPRAVERGFEFKYPALVVVGTVALFATSFTPTFWAEGSVGPGRVQNCRLDIYLLLLVVDVFWVIGWFEAKRQVTAVGAATEFEIPGAPATEDPFEFPAPTPINPVASSVATPRPVASLFSANSVCVWFGIVMLVFACTIGVMATDEDLGEDLSSVSAARSIISGEAEGYDAQVKARLDYIETSTESTLKVAFYHDIPHVLWMGDIRDNMNNYINYRLCQWYGKESIIGVSASDLEAVGVSNE